MTFDQAAAHRGNKMLDIALVRFSELVHRPANSPPGQQEQEELALRAHAYAVEVLTWMRGLHDLYIGNGTKAPLALYEADLASDPAIRGHLGGGRYVANKGIHAFVQLTHWTSLAPMGVAPWGAAPWGGAVQRAVYRWVGEPLIPAPPKKMASAEAENRRAYVDHIAGEDVSQTISVLALWFMRHSH
jgi:hypothetical protein